MTNSKRTEITIVTHEVAVIHGDVATTPSGDPEDGNATSAAARAEQTLRRLRPQLARGGRHENRGQWAAASIRRRLYSSAESVASAESWHSRLDWRDKHKTQHVEQSDEEVRTAAHFRESLVAARCGRRLLSGTQNSGAVSINARAQSPVSYTDAASVVLLYDESESLK